MSILKANEGQYVSGQFLSSQLQVSRTAIWKYINSLKEAGYVIESVSRKGYRIISSPDVMSLDEIKPFLNTKFIGKNITHYDSIESTNKKARELAAESENGLVVTAEEQTSGKGRLGRNWVSPKYKGIWMSIILKPDLNPATIPKITHISAAAVVTALKKLNLDAKVKWPNDIILNNKKVCGILTEMSGEINRTDYVVVGMGINANLEAVDIPLEIQSKASSLLIETSIRVDRKRLAAEILNSFESLYLKFIEDEDLETSIKICREHSILLGREIRIINRQGEQTAKALDITDEGELKVQYPDGSIENIISGEISIRGLNGYI